MSAKTEKLLGIIAAIAVIIGGIVLYLIGVENFPNPEMTEYVTKLILYPSGLVLIRFLWKSSLDNKIKGKEERKEDFRKAMEENDEKK